MTKTPTLWQRFLIWLGLAPAPRHETVETYAATPKSAATRIERILRDYGGLGDDYSINNETDLVRDLQFDSLDLISVAMQIEDEFHIDIPDEDVDKPALGTFGGLVAYVDGKLMVRAQRFRAFHQRIDGLAGVSRA